MLIRMRKTSRIVLHLILAFTHSHLFTFLKQKTKFVGFFFVLGRRKVRRKWVLFCLKFFIALPTFWEFFDFFFHLDNEGIFVFFLLCFFLNFESFFWSEKWNIHICSWIMSLFFLEWNLLFQGVRNIMWWR
jgi:hypothetical protein